MLVGNGKKPNFAPQFTAEERWVSGWNQQFAKLSYPARGTGGSNPPFSAKKKDDGCIVFFFGVWRSPASAPALGAGGRRFESFCPDMKIKELQGFVTPFFGPFQKSGHKKDTLFRNISYRFPILFSNFLNHLEHRTISGQTTFGLIGEWFFGQMGERFLAKRVNDFWPNGWTQKGFLYFCVTI